MVLLEWPICSGRDFQGMFRQGFFRECSGRDVQAMFRQGSSGNGMFRQC